MTGTVSHITASSYLYGNFNMTATNLVTTSNHLNIINRTSDGQGGGFIWRQKISCILSESRIWNKRYIKHLDWSYAGRRKCNYLSRETKNDRTNFCKDNNIDTFRHKGGSPREENERNSSQHRQQKELKIYCNIRATVATLRREHLVNNGDR